LILVLTAAAFGGLVASESSEGNSAKQEQWSRDLGQRLRWKDGAIRIALSDSLDSSTNIKFGSDVSGAIERSLAAWRSVAAVDLISVSSERDSVSPSGNAGDGVSLLTIAGTSENVLFFAGAADSLSAKTRVFYNRRGQITEADIVLNPFAQFSTDGTYGTFDLEAALRHEIGHLLGLSHSEVAGSTMYESVTRNGVLGPRPVRALLSADDVSAVRALYGSPEDEERCCSAITGKLTFSGKAHRDISIWVQEKESGRVVGSAKLARNRSFKIAGLDFSDYEVYANEKSPGKASQTQFLGAVTVADGKSSAIAARFAKRRSDFAIRFLGTSGVLAGSAIFLTRGERRIILVGGDGLDNRSLRLEIDSPYISVDGASLAPIDYAEGVSALSMGVNVDADTPAGNYSIYAVSPTGERHYFVGSITVNP